MCILVQSKVGFRLPLKPGLDFVNLGARSFVFRSWFSRKKEPGCSLDVQVCHLETVSLFDASANVGQYGNAKLSEPPTFR